MSLHYMETDTFHGGSQNRTMNTTSKSFLANGTYADFTMITPETTVFAKIDPVDIKLKTDRLYELFLEIVQSSVNDTEVFETIESMIQTCTETVDDITNSGGIINEHNPYDDFAWLSQELNTWKLLHCLYKDRLLNQCNDDAMNEDSIHASEKEIIERLYKENENLREYQLIVDWLEQCESQRPVDKFAHYMDETVSWENTLHQLQNIDRTVFSAKKSIVKSLDPDAPHRENLPLHDLDAEDEERIAKEILFEIRQGRLDEASGLCERTGQYWRAAILEGWRLHHDPNYSTSDRSLSKYPIEGNARRATWKKLAWQMAESPKTNDYTRAYLGIFCGHLDSLKNLKILNNSWFDMLWLYLKVQIDIRVETELRSTLGKSYMDMPQKYWTNKMTIEEIFAELSTRDNIRAVAEHQMTIIRKYLILDDFHELMRNIDQWIDGLKDNGQMLRFIAHIVLFMRQIGRQNKQYDDIGNNAIQTYVNYLIRELVDPSLVAYYTAALPYDIQIKCYALFLERIFKAEDRRVALDEAHKNRLDTNKIVKYMMQTMCNKIDSIDEQTTAEMSLDERKISALKWLTFSVDQYGELLWFSNVLIRNFLCENKVDNIRAVFKVIPSNVTQQIYSHYISSQYLPAKVECSIFEYACYLLYIESLDAHNTWHRAYHTKPKEPEPLNNDAPFTERMAQELKQQTYLNEIECWKDNLHELTTSAHQTIRKTLFPTGRAFLVDPDTATPFADDDKAALESRSNQLQGIRKLCIPQIVLLLHNILHSSGDYENAIKIVDDLVSEQYQIYTVYSKHQLTEIIAKFAETSHASLKMKLDSWGYPITS